MNSDNLDRLLAAAGEFDASDLHLVAGVPPAYRVNGEIIIADEDALSEEDVTDIANQLLNEQQQKKFEAEWELCISLLHSTAGRVRVTFYRRNGHPELSLRFCGERIASREQLGLPERIDELARKPNGLVEKANPLMGCLPLLVQAPVLYGLYHVLRHLAKPDISPQYKTLYGWTVPLFDSASHARLFGAPIALSFRSNALEAAHLDGTMTAVRVVAAVLILVMIVTTFLTSRQMILKTGWATDPTQLMMQRLMMYGVPIGLLVSGLTFPIGVVIYWVTTNIFSLGQQYYVLRKFPPPANANGGGGTGLFGPTKPKTKTVNGKVVKTVPVIERKTDRKVKDTNDAPVQAKAVTGPKVGAKPVNPKKGNAAKR